MTRYGPAAMILCAALAACQPPEDKRAVDPARDADNGTVVADGNAAENSAEPQRSILRPEVVAPVEEPTVEPEKAVVGFGQSPMALDEAAKATLGALMATPAMTAGGPIILRGHSDSRGADGDNRVASRIRAEKVRDYLLEKGVDGTRITIIALGEGRPIAPNATENGEDDPDGRARNRRVEVDVALPPVILPPPPSAPPPSAPPTPATTTQGIPAKP